ncbi:MAG: hypothetical protein PHT31_06910, partial [Candidatus Omnitrophica bacterium]|nr:hypothetical protein [Candidatus Omnitrophota bacterium]
WLAIYGYRRMVQFARTNIEALSKLLEAPNQNSGFLKLSLEGFYKGRKIILTYFLISDSNNFINPSIEPRAVYIKQKLFSLDYPSITEHTQLRKNRIFYNCRKPYSILEKSNFSWGDIRLFTEEEFRQILEELTQAAEIVERKQGVE